MSANETDDEQTVLIRKLMKCPLTKKLSGTNQANDSSNRIIFLLKKKKNLR